LPENAFLIVEGVREFALLEAVINIGRRLDNHLVIEDPRVSRHHAQLRAINGRFVLFDLDSSGGSFVNGQRLSQGILYPGDVISLAGVTLIYGQDTPLPQPPAGSTAPQPRAGSDRPTTIWRVSDPSGSALG
jgi:pSer/pThr/pTyr-binding forkhead associated (FHA) protein